MLSGKRLIARYVIAGALPYVLLSLVLLTDSIAEAAGHIDSFIKKNYRVAPRRRKWWLFEKYKQYTNA